MGVFLLESIPDDSEVKADKIEDHFREKIMVQPLTSCAAFHKILLIDVPHLLRNPIYNSIVCKADARFIGKTGRASDN